MGDWAPAFAREDYRKKQMKRLKEDIGEVIPVRFSKARKYFTPYILDYDTTTGGMNDGKNTTGVPFDAKYGWSNDRNKGLVVFNLKAAVQGQKFTFEFTNEFKKALDEARDRFGVGRRGWNTD